MNRTGRLPVLLALALLAGVPALAAPPAPARPGKAAPAAAPLDAMKADLLTIQNHVTNANMRLWRKTVGMTPEGAEPGAKPRTPAETCCWINLDAITAALQHLAGTVDQLDVHFARRQDQPALEQLTRVRAKLAIVFQGVSEFRAAATQDRAAEALDGLIRPFRDLRQAVEGLAAFALPEGGKAPSPAGS